ncbi:MAG: Transcriptional regulator, AraC family [uncultured Solirubrobacteraceae bacterium]|uniref:Transcriptional regulator, AraC family n=1 Tax=uncultured Solirubrobacteraceae bacterium TaxID=1162706 RepID=A0A6J4T0E6_9ACTN|nr:MAG: Transcriptional regulator, AraC family [uncultured Solirubrobacteraceae bacterium]
MTPEEAAHLRRAKDLVDRAYAEPLDVAALARQAHASPWHFSRRFKEAYGESPHQYVVTRRVERAQELLRNTGLSVTEICFEVGFESLGSFSSAFHRIAGMTPTAYRAAHAGLYPAIPGCWAAQWTRPNGARMEKPASPAGD